MKKSPLKVADRRFGQEGACGDIAARVSELTGWEVVVLSTNSTGYPWVHAAVRSPAGWIVDTNGASLYGDHIMQDDFHYDAFSAAELRENDGEIEFVVLPASAVGGGGAGARVERIAHTLADWAQRV